MLTMKTVSRILLQLPANGMTTTAVSQEDFSAQSARMGCASRSLLMYACVCLVKQKKDYTFADMSNRMLTICSTNRWMQTVQCRQLLCKWIYLMSAGMFTRLYVCFDIFLWLLLGCRTLHTLAATKANLLCIWHVSVYVYIFSARVAHIHHLVQWPAQLALLASTLQMLLEEQMHCHAPT